MAREKLIPRASAHSQDKLLYAIYIDILNGFNYSRTMDKLNSNGYADIGYKNTKDLGKEGKDHLYKNALKMLKIDHSEIDDMRALFYERYEKLYQDAVTNNDRTTALNTLNAITKFAGLLVDKVDVTSKNVIEIKFGFEPDNEEVKE